MTQWDFEILRAHEKSKRDESMLTQEKRAQRRLERKGFLVRCAAHTFEITKRGRELIAEQTKGTSCNAE